MKNLIRIIALFLCLSLTTAIHSQASLFQPSSPKYEIRAVWLTTIGGIDWPHSYREKEQKDELLKTLDRLKQAGINTVFLQTRVRGTTIYPSALESWDGCISGHPGRAPHYDPLRFAIDECHKRGMQLHAWVVTIPVGKWKNLGCATLRKKNPTLLTKIGDDGYMNPEKPETATYLARICREIVSEYDVDGIHLDYIRYPENWRQRVDKAKGRANITRIVRAIHHEVKSLKPWVMLSCAPIGKHDNLLRYKSNGWNARTTVCQDAQQWLSEGLMDALFPMMYFRANQFFPFAIDWQEQSHGRIIAPGLGIYFLDPREGNWSIEDVTRQMNVLRQIETGHCFFRAKFLLDNVQGLYDFVRQHNATPALIPPMWWQSHDKPQAPRWLEISDDCTLTWQACKDAVYNVYASEHYPVDISKAEHLLCTRLTSNKLVVDRSQLLNYAVTVQDRFGQESEAVQFSEPLAFNAALPFSRWQIPIVDKRLTIPEKPSNLDADYLMIETLEGSPVAIRSYQGTVVDVSGLPEGFYQWRSLGKKGRNHRMGFFSIKRRQLK